MHKQICSCLRHFGLLVLVSVHLGHPPSVAGQALAINEIVTAQATDATHAVFTFSASTPGILTVVVRASDGADLILVVTDIHNQTIPAGRSDGDFGGDVGAEQIAAMISAAGEYRVHVWPWQDVGSGEFDIGATWLAFERLTHPNDVDGTPAAARPIPINQSVTEASNDLIGSIDDSIDPLNGDYWDWYKFQAGVGGTLTVTTRADEGDLVIEAFRPNRFIEPFQRADQDRDGIGGNEAVTVSLTAEQPLYIRIASYRDSGTETAYRLSWALIAIQDH